jgi:hypothetical protein
MAYQNITPEISDETVGQQVQGRKIGLSPIFKVYTFSPTVPSTQPRKKIKNSSTLLTITF